MPIIPPKPKNKNVENAHTQHNTEHENTVSFDNDPKAVDKFDNEPETVTAEQEAAAHEPEVGQYSQANEANKNDYKCCNRHGYRNALLSDQGVVTVIDDDTALILYRNPKFYLELYDSGRGQMIPTNKFTWAGPIKENTGLVVGEIYEKVE